MTLPRSDERLDKALRDYFLADHPNPMNLANNQATAPRGRIVLDFLRDYETDRT
jgi:hypothetical protein